MDYSSLYRDLNNKQRAAVLHDPNCVLQVLAGPGTGKTKLLTSKVAYLLLDHNIKARELIVTTFTKKAANEMSERLMAILKPFGRTTDGMFLGTFHSICFQILRKHGHKVGLKNGHLKIADDTASKDIVKKILEENDLGTGGDLSEAKRGEGKTVGSKDVDSYKTFISKHKCKGLYPSQVAISGSGDYDSLIKLEVYAEYQEYLKLHDLVDFDDCLLYTLRLLQNHSDILNNIQHVLIDEFQDTNMVQMKLMYCFAKRRHLTIVGDPDQSIYSFRYAEIDNFGDMERYYKRRRTPVRKIKLNENYRSTDNILKLSEEMMGGQIAPRESKNLNVNTSYENVPVTYTRYSTNSEEAKNIAVDIKRLIEGSEKYTYNDVAVLIRLSRISRQLEQAFFKSGIPYRIIKGHSFWDLKEVRLMINFLRIVASDSDWLAYEKILEFQVDGLGSKTLRKVENHIMAAAATDNEFNVFKILENYIKKDKKKNNSRLGIDTRIGGLERAASSALNLKAKIGIEELLRLVRECRKVLFETEEVDQLGKKSPIVVSYRVLRAFDFILNESSFIEKLVPKKSKGKGKDLEKDQEAEEEIRENVNELRNQLETFNPDDENLMQQSLDFIEKEQQEEDFMDEEDEDNLFIENYGKNNNGKSRSSVTLKQPQIDVSIKQSQITTINKQLQSSTTLKSGSFRSIVVDDDIAILEPISAIQESTADKNNDDDIIMVDGESTKPKTRGTIPVKTEDYNDCMMREKLDRSGQSDNSVELDTPEDAVYFLSQFLDAIYLYGEAAAKGEDDRKPKVVISTIHQAKGLEWSFVFAPALNDFILPSGHAIISADSRSDTDGMDEERRCFYVQMTRAKEELYLSSYARMEGRGEAWEKTESRFITELLQSQSLRIRDPPRPELKEVAATKLSSNGYFNFADYTTTSTTMNSDGFVSSATLVRRKRGRRAPPPNIVTRNTLVNSAAFTLDTDIAEIDSTIAVVHLPKPNVPPPTVSRTTKGQPPKKRKRLGMGRPLRQFFPIKK